MTHLSIYTVEITGNETHLKSHLLCKYNRREDSVILLCTEKCISIYAANEYWICSTLLSSTQ